MPIVANLNHRFYHNVSKKIIISGLASFCSPRNIKPILLILSDLPYIRSILEQKICI